MKVAGGVLTEEEAAKLASLNLAEWQLFCKTEDQAPPEEDGKYREGWILDVKQDEEVFGAEAQP